MPERIELHEVTKVFQGGNRALCEVSIEVEPGTFLVLLGPSGSGKTTMLRSIAGIEKITSGRIAIGTTIVADGRVHLPPERRDLSMVFQDYALWPHLVALDNVAFALRRRNYPRDDCRRLAGEMLERVGLGALADRYPNELSGGEQQRVALARALVGDTGTVLCDEPLSNLDADLRDRMRVEISSLVRAVGATAVYITHDQAEAFALADKVGVLEKGQLVQFGNPEDIYRAPATPFVARFTGLAGEFAVRIEHDAGDGNLAVSPLEFAPRRPLLARSGTKQQSGGVSSGLGRLMIRPTAVQLRSLGDDDAQLDAQVRDVAFRGRGYELAVDVAGNQLTGVFSATRVERGAHVGLVLEPEGCLVFGDTSPDVSSTTTVDEKVHAMAVVGTTGQTLTEVLGR